jgi:stage V sporulation protein G
MQVSEVRVKLVPNNADRLKAFCSVTFDDCFVVRDLKVIEGTNGLFVAMPSRKLTDHCPHCRNKNHLRSKFCNECGKRLDANRLNGGDHRIKLHADIAHPINSQCRQMIQSEISDAYRKEFEKSKEPGYVPPDFDYDDHEAIEMSDNREYAEPSQQATDKKEPVKESGFSEGIL